MILNMRKFWIWNWFQMKFIEKIYHMMLIFKSIFYMNENKFWQNLCFFTCSFELSQKTHWHFMLCATTSKKGTNQRTLDCSKSRSRQEQNRNIQDLGNGTSSRPYVGITSRWWSLEWKKDLENRRNTSMGRSSELDFLRNKW